MSPDGSLLATIDVSGRLCLWEIPSFRLRREWRVEEMVGVEGVGVESVEEMVDVGMEWKVWEWRVGVESVDVEGVGVESVGVEGGRDGRYGWRVWECTLQQRQAKVDSNLLPISSTAHL